MSRRARHISSLLAALLLVLALGVCDSARGSAGPRPRARDLGVFPGVFQPGEHNAITDVPGVTVGHETLVTDDGVRTGVTAVVPHSGNMFRDKVPAAIEVGNGFGKLLGVTQVRELGQLETPILLTNTLAVWDAATALVERALAHPDNAEVRSVNPVVGETNDGFLNDIRRRPLGRAHFLAALDNAKPGPVEEGSVGAGTGTRAFGFKGGIGTSSRQLPDDMGGHLVGVLVQTNFGGILSIDGVPVGKELGKHAFRSTTKAGDGSCMIVVATNAPLNARQLGRLARRALAGMARTGASFSNGSGDYVIAFSSADTVRITKSATTSSRVVADGKLSPLFQATAEATEEAIYNSLLRATTPQGPAGEKLKALPIERIKAILEQYGRGPSK